MPRTYRKLRRRRDLSMSEEVYRVLTTGTDFFSTIAARGGIDGEPTADEIREVWRVHRDAVLSRFVELHPGSRPWAWWVLDAPGPRRIVAGDPPTPNKPGYSWRPEPGFGMLPGFTEGDRPVYELQRDYLKRHKLLTAEESAALADGAAYYDHPLERDDALAADRQRLLNEKIAARRSEPDTTDIDE